MENKKMDETIPGGIYLSSDGVTYHDANGNVIEPPKQEEVAKPEVKSKKKTVVEE